MFLQGIDTETRQQIENLLALYYKNGGDVPIHLGLLIDLLAELIKKEITLLRMSSSRRKNRGLVQPHRGGFDIEVNFLNPLPQRRFTVAHEIGHILHTFDYTVETPQQRPERASYANFRVNKNEEYICDEIACYILCPQELLVKFLEDFHNIQCQLELFRKKQIPPYYAKMKLLARIFDIPLSKLIWYIKRQFGEEKILSLINSSQ
jgi:Zn-dependent peptidase ImmA (M78 family)